MFQLALLVPKLGQPRRSTGTWEGTVSQLGSHGTPMRVSPLSLWLGSGQSSQQSGDSHKVE